MEATRLEKNKRGNERISEIMTDCEKYRYQLIRYCCKFFKCEYENAEDCVQEAYAKLVEALSMECEIEDYRAWLYSTVNTCVNEILTDRANQNEYKFADNEEKDRAMDEIMFGERDFENEIIDDLMAQEIAMSIISKLDSSDKELFVSYYWKNKKLKDIASDMGVTYANIRKRHQSLKRKLRQIALEEDFV